MTNYNELSRIIECLLFVAGEPLSLRELAKTTETDDDSVYEALRLMRERFTASGLHVVEIAGGWQLSTRPEFAPAIGKLLAPRANRLSKPALETAAIIAYRQPCTQAEVEAIRGVAVDGVLKTLSERELIQEAGRKQTPGRPILYATTPAFLHYFGLSCLEDLPPLDDDSEDAEAMEEMAHTALAAAGAA